MLGCKPSPMPTDILKQFVNVRASLEQERIKLQAQLKEIEAALSGKVPVVKVDVHSPAQPKPKVSAAARAKITAGSKAYWARWRAAKAAAQAAVKSKPSQTAATKPLPKKKRKISAEARKRMGEGSKARWAKVKAEKAKAAK